MSATMLKSFNEFVKNFLKENLDETMQESILEKWEEAQNDLKKSLKNQEKKEEKKKEKKASKDPNAPKKNKSAYIFFCIDERSKIKSENPEMPAKEIISELASRWKSLKEDDLDKLKTYEQMAKDDKTRYNTETVNSDGDSNKSKLKKDDKKKIKKNKTAYIFFCEENRASVKVENPEMTAKDIIRELASRWKDAKNDPDTFAFYKQKEEEDKERYNTEKANMSESEPENVEKMPVEKKEKVEKKPVENKEKVVEKPVKNEKKVEKKPVKKVVKKPVKKVEKKPVEPSIPTTKVHYDSDNDILESSDDESSDDESDSDDE